MDNKICLSRLKPGQQATIVKTADKTPLQKRLRSLGLTEGAKVTALFRSPLGDPVAYDVEGSVIALRKTDSEHILVEISGEHDE